MIRVTRFPCRVADGDQVEGITEAGRERRAAGQALGEGPSRLGRRSVPGPASSLAPPSSASALSWLPKSRGSAELSASCSPGLGLAAFVSPLGKMRPLPATASQGKSPVPP